MLQDPTTLAEAELLAERADAAIYGRRTHFLTPQKQPTKNNFRKSEVVPMDVDQLQTGSYNKNNGF